KAAIARQMSDIGCIAGNQVIHCDNLMPLSQKSITQMRPEETGAAGYEYAHGQAPSVVESVVRSLSQVIVEPYSEYQTLTLPSPLTCKLLTRRENSCANTS